MSSKEIMILANKLIDALVECEDEALIECIEDAIIKKDKFSDVCIENWDDDLEE